MLKVSLQLFGGRGARSNFGGDASTSGNGRGPRNFYDVTKNYKGMSLHEFEAKIRDRKSEYIGLFDKDGKLIVAGTSYNKGAVLIPTNHPNFKEATTMTHNHPYYGSRIIGGSFSDLDLYNHIEFGFKETRAVSNGPREFSYIFKNKPGAQQNAGGAEKTIEKINRQWKAQGIQKVNQIEKGLNKKGKSLNGKGAQVYLGTGHGLYKRANFEQYGYQYINVKDKRW